MPDSTADPSIEHPPTTLVEAPTAELAGPVIQRDRIVAIDVLRGFALLGILVMNIRMFASVFASYGNPTVFVDWTGANPWVWLVGHLFADLKMMSVFSMLFGAGIVLMATRQHDKGLKSVGVHYRRMLWLLVIGLAHAYLLWPGDILVMYAIIGMMVYWARRWYVPVQIVLGLVLLGLGTLILYGSAVSMEYWPAESVDEIRAMWAPSEEAINNELAVFRGSWWDQMALRVPFSFGLQTGGILFFGIWRVGGLMLLGMGLYRLGVFSARRSVAMYLAMTIIGAAVGLTLIYIGYLRNVEAGFSFETSSMMSTNALFNYVGSLFVALAWVGAVMLVVKSRVLSVLTGALAAVGQMAFTNYLGQSIICTTIFYGHGFGLFGQLDYLEQAYVVGAIWAFQLVMSPIWLRYFRYGPFEWLWRSLTYWCRQPMLRGQPT